MREPSLTRTCTWWAHLRAPPPCAVLRSREGAPCARRGRYQIVVLDKLSYASKGYDRLRNTGVFHQIQTFCYDLNNPMPPGLFYEMDSNNIEVCR